MTAEKPTHLTWLAVQPLDTVMVRDGRSFLAGDASGASSVAPPPTTLGGVVRTVLGRNAGRILGPVVDVDGEPLFPLPRDIVWDGDTWRRLGVEERRDDAVSDLDDSHHLSHALTGDGDWAEAWVTGGWLADWLTADSLAPGEPLPNNRRRFAEPPWRPEHRLGLARHWDGDFVGTANSGLLYTMSHLRPLDEMRFLVGCEDPDPITLQRTLVPLGGRGRLATVSVAESADPLPRHPGDFPGGRVAVYLATPALLDDVLWTPPDATAELCALAVGGPAPIAHASPRHGRDFGKTRLFAWAVPAGSVFYLRFDPAGDAAAWARKHHGRLLPGQSTRDRVKDIIGAGFGTCLIGRW
ncbi:type III-B CRISPR module-associated Cmr3 family protein [Gandjariella thermophila]|uniref:CRISPR-associated protein Cmr3 n=1 Tax=Gandjariella thermophila TaxID=1931992 RepID=A0A4D4IXI6_9PSEU|nr:type III-B CRISPR module-associated Cmr3 family protein [Gandjariella thermophila]GDY29085.1 CRISPR-associated protein Cmr3 [Gandjariella thermophila]